MKSFHRLLLAFGFSTLALAADSGAPEIVGIMAGTEAKVSLRETSTGETRWVKTGETFRGYSIRSIDPGAESVVVVRDGVESTLQLKVAKVMAGTGSTTEKLKSNQAKLIYHNLRQIASAADQYYLENGRVSVTLPELVGPTKYIKQLKPVVGESYDQLVLKQGTPLAVTTGSGETVGFSDGGDRPPGNFAFRVVRAGDTGARIAESAGLSVNDLRALNDDLDFNRLKTGDLVRTK